MKPQEAVVKETGHIAIGTLILTAVMLAVFAIIGRFNLNVLFGGLYGCALAVANFFFLGLTVQRIAESAQTGSEEVEPDAVKLAKLAKLKMRQSYMLRMLLGAGLLIVALAVLKLNWIACVCPLIFPRITISVMNAINRVRSVKGSGEIK